MDWTDKIALVIDLRTFASIWYWFAVVVSWAVACHWLIGVPFDLLFRARKGAPQDLADLESIVDINVRRFTGLADILGLWLLGFVTFVLTGLGVAGFYYGFELAQGQFVLGAPLTLVLLLNIKVAYDLRANPATGRDLVDRLFKMRLWSQGIGMIAIFLTAMYGMWFNIDSLYLF